MKTLLKIAALLVMTTFLAAGCNNDDASAKNSPKENETVKNVSSEQEQLTLSDLRGKVVIVDFWATWCPPCRKGVPDLISLKNQYDQVEVVGVSLDAISRGGATANDVVPFMEQYGINYPIVKGDQDIVMQYGGIRSIPTSFVIDRRGFVIARHVGLVAVETYKNDIEKALAGNYNREEYMRAPDFTLPTIK